MKTRPKVAQFDTKVVINIVPVIWCVLTITVYILAAVNIQSQHLRGGTSMPFSDEQLLIDSHHINIYFRRLLY